jgi:hypothetical protein
MNDISGGADPLKEMVEQMKRDAWAAGWNAAMAAVNTALAEVMPTMDISGATPTLPGLQTRNALSSSNLNSTALPTVGTTPHYVYEAVRRKQGMTGAEVIAAVRADGHDVAEPQIRTALSRLATRQLLANRHRKWFLKG